MRNIITGCIIGTVAVGAAIAGGIAVLSNRKDVAETVVEVAKGITDYVVEYDRDGIQSWRWMNEAEKKFWK
tara:strand:+ start:145 stop:357 length:213 start_codon:yes stop_codon:yes gene_type:complete